MPACVIEPFLLFHAQQFAALRGREESFLGYVNRHRKGFLMDNGAQAKLLGVLGGRVEEPKCGSPFLPDGGETTLPDESADLSGG
jgi:hypothetical protein